MAGAAPCLFCQIARSSTSTQLLYSDEKVVAFRDINPSAFRHYLVIPVEHISTVKDLKRTMEDYKLVSHMLDMGQTLLHKDAPDSKQYRFSLRDEQIWCLLMDFSSNPNFSLHLLSNLKLVTAVLDSMGAAEGWKGPLSDHYHNFVELHLGEYGRVERRDTSKALPLFGFHQPPFNSVNHLHLHCFALPFIPSWKHIKYTSLGPLGGFIEATKLLQKLKP